ncbi:MAG: thermonuclease family protein [Lentisphaeria bacterium]|nr:thermonuclease family protein [Lentisphaeria bacterium]
MAKKEKDKEKEKKGGREPVVSWFTRLKQRVVRTLLILAAFIAGILVGNIDRLDSRGVELLQYKRYIPSVLHIFLPGGLAKFVSAAKNDELNGRIIEVYDGDTAILLDDNGGKKYKIRFYGMDAPEASQEYGIASRNALREKILGQSVRIVVVNTDQYGRCVGKVYRENRYINLEMVQEGNAWHYHAYARNAYEFAAAQRKARQDGIGLWKAAAPMPPWDYRTQNK